MPTAAPRMIKSRIEALDGLAPAKIEKSFDAFHPREYLKEYYADIDSENLALLRFFAETYAEIPAGQRVLEFGGGPTVYSLISSASKASTIDFADHLRENLHEVKSWVFGSPSSFYWGHFIRRALELEGVTFVSEHDVAERKRLLRSRFGEFFHCDAFSARPIADVAPGSYDVLSVNFVPESITASRDACAAALGNITSLLRQGGRLVITTLIGSTSYTVGARRFAAVKLSPLDIGDMLALMGYCDRCIYIERAVAIPGRGYAGIALTRAAKLDSDGGCACWRRPAAS